MAAAAYRSGERLYDGSQQRLHDYRSRKGSVVHTEILAPEGSADFLKERNKLWNHAEQLEKRKDAQLARELEIALPKELTQEQRLELVRDFVKAECVSRGMVADLAIHVPQPDKGDHPDNHHAHVMLTLRQATPTGLHPVKTREWNSQSLLKHWRQAWAEHQNRALERFGHKARVDHRTLMEQRQDALKRGDLDRAAGLDRQPEIHVGKAARHRKDQPVSRDRETRRFAGFQRWNNYTKIDQGSRAEQNLQILNDNRKLASNHSEKLQASKARLMQVRVKRPVRGNSIEQNSNVQRPFIASAAPDFDKTKLGEEMGEAVQNYLVERRVFHKLGLLEKDLDSLSARISFAMGIQAVRNARYYDFRNRYIEKKRVLQIGHRQNRFPGRVRYRKPLKSSP